MIIRILITLISFTFLSCSDNSQVAPTLSPTLSSAVPMERALRPPDEPPEPVLVVSAGGSMESQRGELIQLDWVIEDQRVSFEPGASVNWQEPLLIGEPANMTIVVPGDSPDIATVRGYSSVDVAGVPNGPEVLACTIADDIIPEQCSVSETTNSWTLTVEASTELDVMYISFWASWYMPPTSIEADLDAYSAAWIFLITRD